jgi:hypothetical protein
MRSLVSLCALVVCGGALVGCTATPPKISWIHLGPRCRSRPPEAVSLYFTRSAVPRDFRVVARYEVRASGGDLTPAVRALLRRAAEDGSDAVLLERGVGAAVTVWSWLLLFVPLQERAHVLHASGLRFGPEGGASCPRS